MKRENWKNVCCVAILSIKARSLWIYMKMKMKIIYVTIDEKEYDIDVLNDYVKRVPGSLCNT